MRTGPNGLDQLAGGAKPPRAASSFGKALTPVLSISGLTTSFMRDGQWIPVVRNVSFDVAAKETVAIVGESGSGKSVTALSIIGLHPKPAARIVGGEILFDGKDLAKLRPDELRRYRGSHISLILQDPMTALNPAFSIGAQIGESLDLHTDLRGGALRARIVELLRLLRISDPERRVGAFPHQLSGGMRQRSVGAIALSGTPEILIADEPTTALDVTVQAAYLALLKDIQRRTGVAILFITHDFGVVAKMCDSVAVMYAGKIVEAAPAARLMSAPSHPYTEALLKAVPDMDRPTARLVSIEGQPPSIRDLPSGCRFHPRCWLYERLGRPEVCRTEEPSLRAVVRDQGSACHFADVAVRTDVNAAIAELSSTSGNTA